MICQEEKLIFRFAPDGAWSPCPVINPQLPRGARVLPAGGPQLESLPATDFLLQFCRRQIASCVTRGTKSHYRKCFMLLIFQSIITGSRAPASEWVDCASKS